MRFAFILALVMAAVWVVLSGYFTTFILSLGVISIVIVLWICSRMKILDGETVPYLSLPKTLSYFVWLFSEIVKANMAVVKAVLSPDLKVSPCLTKIPLDCGTDMGRAMFANSITLTPGTVSVNMEDDHILVHALLKEMSKPADFAEMGARAAWSVGEVPRKNGDKV